MWRRSIDGEAVRSTVSRQARDRIIVSEADGIKAVDGLRLTADRSSGDTRVIFDPPAHKASAVAQGYGGTVAARQGFAILMHINS